MNKLIAGLALLFVVVTTGSAANAAPWCAYYDSSTYNCGFHSYEQCLATIRGVGGWCARNHYEGYSGNPGPSGRKARDRRR